LIQEINKRRTLAIISHPDAGKTTLTEKLLLYGGALDLAGSVTAKKKQRETASDWMELEKKRGISISSTLLQFEYQGVFFNLLDTPGHKDFSEDTYRVLTAVDAVIMVIDGAKGIESQTLKLFEICRQHQVPIFTFINKLDRPTKSPLELLDQIEKELDLAVFPMNWPIESGPYFKGVYHRLEKQVYLFERTTGGKYKAPVYLKSLQDESFKSLLSQQGYQEFTEEVELLEETLPLFSVDLVKQGKLSPVFFGSAVNNFGIELFLKGFLQYSTPPLPRKTKGGELLPLDNPNFAAFIFKIQTNMNPKHRDKMVFARVCAGQFKRGMKVFHSRTQREIRLSSAHSLFGNERDTVDESYAGDIIGFVSNADFKIGDTISSNPQIQFESIPKFAPELFGYLTSPTTSSFKAFRKGLDHLIGEDIVQTFQIDFQERNVPLLGALGILQFEVLQYRLKEEYGVETKLEMLPFKVLRWVHQASKEELRDKIPPYGCALGEDDEKSPVLFFDHPWSLQTFQEKNPTLILKDSQNPLF